MVDSLVSSNSEQFRARIGKLLRIPYREHPPSRFPTTVVRFLPRPSRVCFLMSYAEGCVPSAVASIVRLEACPDEISEISDDRQAC